MRSQTIRLWVTTVVIALIGAVGIAAETDVKHVPGQIVVRLDQSTTLSQANALAAGYGLEVRKAIRVPGMFVLQLPNTQIPDLKAVTQEKLNQLKADSRVHHAVPNYIYDKYQIPNDPDFGPLATQQWNLFQIGLPGASGAWAISKGASNVIVVDTDDSYFIGHPDFNDKNGVPRWFNPYNAEDGSTNVYDQQFSHGTMTMSVIVAGTDNNLNMSGVTWEGVRCVPIRISDANGSLTYDAIIAAFQYIIDWNSDPENTVFTALNMSWGRVGGGIDPTEALMLATIRSQGTWPVAAAGNSRPFFPAGWPASYTSVISVAATDYNPDPQTGVLRKGYPTSYSSQGLPDRTQKVDLAAPSAGAARVRRLNNFGDSDGGGGGTSYSSPTVVGAIALLVSAGMDPEEVFEALKATAVVRPGDLVPNIDTGWGEIAMQDAISLIGPTVRPLSPLGDPLYEYQTVRFEFRLFQIRSNGPAPVVTATNLTTGYSFNVPDTEWSVIPDPDNEHVSFLRGKIRLFDPNRNSGDGRWTIHVLGFGRDDPNEEAEGVLAVQIRARSLASGTSMFSVPFQLEGQKPEDLFAPGFSMFRWLPSIDPNGEPTGTYVKYQPGGAANQDGGLTPGSAEIIKRTQVNGVVGDTLQHGPFGVGTWVKTTTSSILQFVEGPEDDVVFYRIRLKRGWNQFGNPFPFPVDWNTCVVSRPETPDQGMSILDAANRLIIRPQVFSYQIVGPGDTKDYRWASPPNGQLMPFESHWVYAIEECWLQVNPAPGQSRSRSGEPEVKGGGWLVRMRASSNGTEDGANYFGVTKDLNDIVDRVAEPPVQPGGVQLWFDGLTSGNRLAQDVRELSRGRETFKMTVRPSQPNEDILLSWADIVRPQGRMRMTLKDEATGRTITMQPNGTYTFNSGASGADRRFTVIVQPESSGRIVIGGVRISGGSRSGGSFAINYNLSSDANVNIQILSTTGKMVAQLESRSRSAGSNSVSWNGRDSRGVAVAPGVYMVQITAETPDGERARTTTPVTVTR